MLNVCHFCGTEFRVDKHGLCPHCGCSYKNEYVPTLAQIKREAEAIRKTWSNETFNRRTANDRLKRKPFEFQIAYFPDE